MPVDAQTRQLNIAVEEPAEFAAYVLAHLLAARGIKVDGVPRARHAGARGAAAERPRRPCSPSAPPLRLQTKFA